MHKEMEQKRQEEMITARAYINPTAGDGIEHKMVDTYLGNAKTKPIFMSEFDKIQVSHDESDALILRIIHKESISLVKADRLYVDKDLPHDTVMTSNEIASNPTIMSKIQTITIQRE